MLKCWKQNYRKKKAAFFCRPIDILLIFLSRQISVYFLWEKKPDCKRLYMFTNILYNNVREYQITFCYWFVHLLIYCSHTSKLVTQIFMQTMALSKKYRMYVSFFQFFVIYISRFKVNIFCLYLAQNLLLNTLKQFTKNRDHSCS